MLHPEQYLRPEVARLVARLDLRAKFIVRGLLAGMNSSPARGRSLEFAEHRNYAPGDDPKTLDWTAWARTDRLFVKTFQSETNLDAYILLDTSRGMAWAGQGAAMTKLEYGTALAAALAYLLVRRHDAAGLGLVGSGLERLIRPRQGRRQLTRLLATLASITPAAETSIAPAIHAAASKIRRKSLVVLISDLVDEPKSVLEALRHMAFSGHDIIVFQVLDSLERSLDISGPVILEDPETGCRLQTDADAVRQAYRRRMEEWTTALERGVRELGGDFVSMTTDTPFDLALARFLSQRRRARRRTEPQRAQASI